MTTQHLHLRYQSILYAGVLTTLLLFSLKSWSAESSEASGREVSFDEIWQKAQSESETLQAAKTDATAAAENSARLGRHWLPRLYLDARAYSTDDPGNAFVSILNQRAITATDFSPSSLNHPDSQTVQRAAIGVDLPLYEGGMRTALSKASDSMAEAKKIESKLAHLKEYLDLASQYGQLVSLDSERDKLNQTNTDLEKTLKGYKVGSKSNPVGYSGLLGLKNLQNRIKGLLLQNEIQQAQLRNRIQTSTPDLPEKWRHISTDLQKFVNAYLPAGETSKVAQPSLAARAALEQARATEQFKTVERSRLRPRIGLFAENVSISGDRDSANSTTSGVYLQWDIFSGTQFGAGREAELKHFAAQSQARAVQKQMAAFYKTARDSDVNIAESLKLLQESSSLLEEQTRIAHNLFRNGAIQALQLVEVLARRLDMIASQTEAEKNFIQARTGLLMSSGIEEVHHAK